jgi:hypothetical protein
MISAQIKGISKIKIISTNKDVPQGRGPVGVAIRGGKRLFVMILKMIP